MFNHFASRFLVHTDVNSCRHKVTYTNSKSEVDQGVQSAAEHLTALDDGSAVGTPTRSASCSTILW